MGLLIEQVGYGHPHAVRLIADLQQEFVVRYGSPDEGPIEPAMFEPPRGSFFVGYDGDQPVATGAWRRRSDLEAIGAVEVAEIKRMYVAPQARGKGYARAMLAHLEQTARAAGAEAMVLETGLEQPEAIALYGSEGYRRIPNYGFYRHEADCRCFAKRLA